MPINKEQSENKTNIQSQSGRASFAWEAADKARDDLKGLFGFVPTFMNNYTEQSLSGAWAEAKTTRFGENTALDKKLKGLIALAIGAQVPCDRLNYFEQKATLVDGATRQEQLEAVLMAAITRRWSTVLNGCQIDKVEFRKEVDQIMAYVKKMMEDSGGNLPAEEMFLVSPKNAEDTYKDIKETLGMVPTFFQIFPKESIAGAWSEFKALQLNPYTALNGRQKEIIGVAVAAQIPCDYCIYFHRNAAKLNGADERELNEAVSVAACVRHWSTVFHGPQIDMASFKKDADQMLRNISPMDLQ